MSLGSNFETVLQAARLGEEWAWSEIYRDLAPVVRRYLCAKGAFEPDDLLGETFVRVVRSLPSFDGSEDQFRAWVFTLARNGLIDAWRRESGRPVECVPPEAFPNDSAETPSAEDVLMQNIAYERVRSILGRLSEHQRDVIFLRVIAGLSIEEVAQVLGKRPGAVKSLQVRGLAAIRREISGEAVSK